MRSGSPSPLPDMENEMSDQPEASQIMSDAQKIADMIRATNTDLRHVLYVEIAIELRKWSQGHTASQFKALADADELGMRYRSPPPQ